MAIFVQNQNVESNQSFGQVINKVKDQFVIPELKHRKIADFKAAGVEIFNDGKYKVYLDNEVQILIEFKNKKISPSDTGKAINVDLQEIKNLSWSDPNLIKNSAKILIIHFNKDWWIYWADFKKISALEEKFKVTQTFKIRGGDYLPLNMRKEEKGEFLKGYRLGLEQELPQMWKRHITISQKYTGVMAYDGNYFDLFHHAQELFVLGFYYSSIIICRSAAEQALIRILTKVGQGLEIYRKNKKGRKEIKGIKELVNSCRNINNFPTRKYPINKTAEKKLMEISYTASDLVHPKHDLDELEAYKKQAIKCMDNLQYVVKNHLNFIKDTGVVSGYRITGSAKRLK